jgi:hypothetical protein
VRRTSVRTFCKKTNNLFFCKIKFVFSFCPFRNSLQRDKLTFATKRIFRY